jgi:hypothetical protein
MRSAVGSNILYIYKKKLFQIKLGIWIRISDSAILTNGYLALPKNLTNRDLPSIYQRQGWIKSVSRVVWGQMEEGKGGGSRRHKLRQMKGVGGLAESRRLHNNKRLSCPTPPSTPSDPHPHLIEYISQDLMLKRKRK